MIIDVLTIIYIVMILLSLAKTWRKLPKSAATGFLSGAVLLGYTVFLNNTGQMSSHSFVVVLAVALIQLAAFEVGKAQQKINWLHHLIRLAVHIIIVWGMLT